MKIIEALNGLDRLTHNAYGNEEKVQWLSRVDSMVKRQIIDTHEGWERIPFSGYDEKTDLNQELLVPEPFCELYIRYLEAQVHYHDQEYEGYNSAILLFNTAFQEFANYYNRNNMPITRSRFRF